MRLNIYGKKVYYPQYDRWTLQNIVYIPRQDSTLMTFIDITAQEKRLRQEQETRNETIALAHNVIRNQMFTAQKIASLLGETTAETKMTLTRLTRVIQDEPAPAEDSAELLAHAAGDAFPQQRTAETDAADSADFADLGLPAVPAAKPKLKINTQYAKPHAAPDPAADSGQAGRPSDAL